MNIQELAKEIQSILVNFGITEQEAKEISFRVMGVK